MIARTMAVSVALCAILLGCEDARTPGSGVAKTESRDVGSFSGVELRGAAKLELSTGSLRPIEVTADDNLLSLIETRVENGRLVIDTGKKVKPKTEVVIKATAPNIALVQCAGAAKVVMDGVGNERLDLSLSGAGELVASGRTENLAVQINGAGSLDADKLTSAKAKIEINGAGDAAVHATESLNVKIAGTGSVEYVGDPKVEKTILGAGSISKKR